ncbi:amidohydrolase [Leucobacter sp. wl10]|uniref:amidohydrolase n=1 Tax=Leucobacter sp. wl10 TaxID=2304677 RepID=UPI000E5B39F5|nr:amidohydrolase family protein [Leucobacter sp. wl10]RGE23273.1 hypothetical protein D1J51_03310 [Leucobacter sp. wl10]
MSGDFGGARLSGEDLLLTGGRIFADAEGSDPAEAMLVRAGRVEALGSAENLWDRAGPSAPSIDLRGRVVLPGMIDAHTHVEFSAMARSEWLDVRGLTPDEVCERIGRAAVQRTDPDAWIVAQGTFLQPLPGREQLDAVSDGVPVLVRESMHRLQANTTALRRAGMGHAAPTVSPGVVVHVDRAGVPTGAVDEGFHLFPVPALPGHRLAAILRSELRDAFARHGVTTVYDIPASRGAVDAYGELATRGELPTRVTLTPVVAPGLSPLLERIDDWDPASFGDGIDSPFIAAGGIKIFIDGDNDHSFDESGLSVRPRNWGAVTRTLGGLREELIWATRHDVQVWVHAIGDLAQDLVLEAVEQAAARVGPPRLPTRIEHAGNLKLDAGLVARMRELGVVPVPTANFMSTDDGSGLYAYRSLIDAGFRPPGNSDTGGAIAEAPNPWFGIALMRLRRNRRGRPVAPDERATVLEGVRGYTADAAAVAGLDGIIGRLAPGYAADFAVYDRDPRFLDPESMTEAEAEMTYVGGRRTWQRGS